MNNEIESKNSKNKFELEGNVGNIGTIYTNTNSKKMLRFDLCQNNNGNSQFIPIVNNVTFIFFFSYLEIHSLSC